MCSVLGRFFSFFFLFFIFSEFSSCSVGLWIEPVSESWVILPSSSEVDSSRTSSAVLAAPCKV